MGRSLCVANQKGGVGKTTTALNLAGALAKAGCQTLLVDLDPQCNATTGLGRQPVTSHPLVSGTPIRQGVVATDVQGLDLLPGSRTFRDVETLTKDDAVQAAQLREHLTRGFSTYDYILIDCPPSLGPLTEDGPGQFRRSADADPVRVLRHGGPDADDRHDRADHAAGGPYPAVRRHRADDVRSHAWN